MKIKFKILCCSCHCCFELDSEKFTPHKNLCCPNCGQMFPEKEFMQLQETMLGIQGIPEVCASSPEEKGFQVSIDYTENDSDGKLPL